MRNLSQIELLTHRIACIALCMGREKQTEGDRNREEKNSKIIRNLSL